MKLNSEQAQETDLAQITLRITVEALMGDGLVSADQAEAWLSCHAIVLVDSSWSRCLNSKLRSWLGLDESHFKPVVVRICGAPAAAFDLPKS